MHCHSGDFIRSCMRSDCCGYCQNKQDGGRRVSSLKRKTRSVFANFLEKWLHYKVNKYPMTKNKPIYHARNLSPWKGSVKPRPFVCLLILEVINRFIFGHRVLIYYIYIYIYIYIYTERERERDKMLPSFCTWISVVFPIKNGLVFFFQFLTFPNKRKKKFSFFPDV